MGKKPNKTRARQQASSRGSNRRAAATRARTARAASARRSESAGAPPDPAQNPADAVSAVAAEYLRGPHVVAHPVGAARTRPPHVSAADSESATDALRSVAVADENRAEPMPRTGRSGCAEQLSELPQGLAATYWGEAAGDDLSIRFTGIRDNPALQRRERFEHTATVSPIPAGSGRFAITSRIDGINGGDWDVSASLEDATTARTPQRTTIHTRPAFLAYGPSVRLWSWPALVGTGAVFAFVLQALLLARADMNVAAAIGISILGCLLGYLGAKGWYLVLKRAHPRTIVKSGACIQGFLLVALGVLAIGGAAAGIGVGTLLDATTPGLFLGMAIGRPGCFLTGCCAGRPTMSRWGLWSSNRTVAVRRVPVQLWEAAAALVIGAVTLTLTLTTDVPIAGALFIGALAAYTAVRQLLFPFRADPHTRRGRYATIAACAAVIVADLVLVVLR